MKRLLLALCLLSTPAWASDAVLTWQAASNATSYELHQGTAPGVYNPPLNVGNVLTYTYADGTMSPNVRNYLALTASNASGTSGLSQEINGFPRPTIISTNVTDMTTFLRLTVVGSNFSDGMSASSINFVGMTIIAVNRLSATSLEIDYTVDDGFQDTPTDLIITNNWSGNAGFLDSLPSEVFIVPGIVPPPPAWTGID